MGVITPAQKRRSCEKWIVIWVCSCQIRTVSRIFELFILEAESAVAVMGEYPRTYYAIAFPFLRM